MKNILTIALTVYDPKIQEIENWKNDFNSINIKGVNKVIYSDNPTLDKGLFKNFKDTKLIWTEKNTGKTQSIINISKKIDSKYLKVVDPDDRLGNHNIEKLIIKLNKIDDAIILHRYDKNIFSKRWRARKRGVLYKAFNWFTIYPVNLTSNIEITHVKTYGDDQIIVNNALNNGARIKKVSNYLYEHKYSNGITKVENNNESISNYLKEVKSFVKEIMIMFPDASEKKILNTIDIPIRRMKEFNIEVNWFK